MAQTRFEQLDIYKLSESLADLVWGLVMEWSSIAQDTIGKQLIRSADSIGANIAEGSGRGTTKDRRYFMRISRGSLYETQHWLRRAYQRKLLKKSDTIQLKPIIDELAPKLNAYIGAMK